MLRPITLAVFLALSVSGAHAQTTDLDAPLETQAGGIDATTAEEAYVEPEGLGDPDEDALAEEEPQVEAEEDVRFSGLPMSKTERKMMRTCVDSYAGDPNINSDSVGAFCGCYVQELLRDQEENPEVYASGEKKSYYSSKEEAEKKARVLSAFKGHEEYCLKVVQ